MKFHISSFYIFARIWIICEWQHSRRTRSGILANNTVVDEWYKKIEKEKYWYFGAIRRTNSGPTTMLLLAVSRLRFNHYIDFSINGLFLRLATAITSANCQQGGRWEKYEYTDDSSNGNRIVEPELVQRMAPKRQYFSFSIFCSQESQKKVTIIAERTRYLKNHSRVVKIKAILFLRLVTFFCESCELQIKNKMRKRWVHIWFVER
jgi:hypothetical protein